MSDGIEDEDAKRARINEERIKRGEAEVQQDHEDNAKRVRLNCRLRGR